MLGIPPPARALIKGFNWENATRVLWIYKKTRIVHMSYVKAHK